MFSHWRREDRSEPNAWKHSLNLIRLQFLHECCFDLSVPFPNISLPHSGYETWCLTLMEGHRLRVLRRIFGPKRDEIIGDWRKLHGLAQTSYCDQMRWANGSWVLRRDAKPGSTDSLLRLHGWCYGDRWDRIWTLDSVLLARRHVL
jgi:hypothetical protein